MALGNYYNDHESIGRFVVVILLVSDIHRVCPYRRKLKPKVSFNFWNLNLRAIAVVLVGDGLLLDVEGEFDTAVLDGD